MHSFHSAIRNNDISEFKQCLDVNTTQACLNTKLNEIEVKTGFTPLQLAVCLGNLNLASQLLIHGADAEIWVFKRPSYPSIHDLIETRQAGTLFRDLIRFATGALLDGTENIAVFHVLFYQALVNNCKEQALKFLFNISQRAPASLQEKIKNTLSGALVFSFTLEDEEITNKILAFLQTKNLTQILFSWQKKLSTKESQSDNSLLKMFHDNNYIEISETLDKNILKNLPLNETTLPWLMLAEGARFRQQVSQLILDEKQQELRILQECCGYDLQGHLYRLIAYNQDQDAIKLMSKKSEYHFKHMLAYAVLDTGLNWSVLDYVPEKTDLRKFILSEHERTPSPLSALVVRILGSIPKNDNTAGILSQPRSILIKFTTYLDQKSIYAGFARTSKYMHSLAQTSQLSYPPEDWQLYSTLNNKMQDLTNLIEQLSPVRAMSFGDWVQDDRQFFGCCFLGVIAPISCSLFLLWTAVSAGPASYPLVSLFSYGVGGIAILTPTGYTFDYCVLKCEGNLPGYTFEKLEPALERRAQYALTLLSQDAKPQNTKDLLVALGAELQLIERIKEQRSVKRAEVKLENREVEKVEEPMFLFDKTEKDKKPEYKRMALI